MRNPSRQRKGIRGRGNIQNSVTVLGFYKSRRIVGGGDHKFQHPVTPKVMVHWNAKIKP